MTANPLTPSPALLCKLGSLIVHADEGRSMLGHAYDWTAFDSLLADANVQEWIHAMQRLAMLPVKRTKADAVGSAKRKRKP